MDKLLNDTMLVFVKQILDLLPDKPIQKIFSTATVELSDITKIEELSTKKFHTISTHRAVETAKTVTLRYLLMPEHVKDCYFV